MPAGNELKGEDREEELAMPVSMTAFLKQGRSAGSIHQRDLLPE